MIQRLHPNVAIIIGIFIDENMKEANTNKRKEKQK